MRKGRGKITIKRRIGKEKGYEGCDIEGGKGRRE